MQRGTGGAVRRLVDKPVGGKTGTTNDYRDAWFVGFSPDIAAGAYVGFDQPSPLGEGEAGGRAAAPIFGEFMAEALKDEARAEMTRIAEICVAMPPNFAPVPCVAVEIAPAIDW